MPDITPSNPPLSSMDSNGSSSLGSFSRRTLLYIGWIFASFRCLARTLHGPPCCWLLVLRLLSCPFRLELARAHSISSPSIYSRLSCFGRLDLLFSSAGRRCSARDFRFSFFFSPFLFPILF